MSRRIPFSWFLGGLALASAIAFFLRDPIREAFGGGSEPSPSPSVAAAPPACRYGAAPAPHGDPSEWRLTLLDTTYRLSSTYAPEHLVSTHDAGFHEGLLVSDVLIEDLTALRAAAAEAGVPIEPTFGYRSYENQEVVFADSVRQRGRREALRHAARPGHSEHQLGTTIDFKSAGAPNVTPAWGHQPAGRWMARNAWRYGFVLSYPAGRTDVTCYAYEPWHFRYFGRRLAAAIHRSGLTSREFLWARSHRR